MISGSAPRPGRPFRIDIGQPVLDDLSARLARTRWPDEADGPAWQHGTGLDYLRRLVACWRDEFDWRSWEARINRFEQRLVDVDGQLVHVLVEPGSGPSPLPLLLTHGWPGSFLEFIDMIEPLAHPERFGGRVEDAFTVVVPSLPGYGWSPTPTAPLGPRAIARLWHLLAVEHFGFERYVAQGGDWGAIITGLLGRLHPRNLAAIHLNMFGNMPQIGADFAPSDEERAWLGRMQHMRAAEGAYQQLQGTKPQTLAYGLTDSPAGLAGWIVEKFQGWTIGGSEQDPPFDMQWLIANVMVYWLNGINGANRLYLHAQESQVAPQEAHTVPAGLSLFPADLIPPPPRSLCERVYDVRSYRVMPQGGHFPAVEQGPLLAGELRDFFRGFR